MTDYDSRLDESRVGEEESYPDSDEIRVGSREESWAEAERFKQPELIEFDAMIAEEKRRTRVWQGRAVLFLLAVIFIAAMLAVTS